MTSSALPREIRRSGGDEPVTTSSFTDRGRALIAAGVMLTAGGLALGFPDLARVGALLVLLPVLARLLGRASLPSLAVTRSAEPAVVTTGVPSTVRCTVRPVAGETGSLFGEDALPASLGARSRFLLPAMDAAHPATVSYLIRPDRRGRFVVGPMRVTRRDPFGVTTRSAVIPGRLEVLALPQVRPLHGMRTTGGAGTEGVRPTMTALHGEDDASIRAYRTGDDLRRVHWPATAHRGTLMMRHEGTPSIRRAVLVLDALLGPHSPTAGAGRHDAGSTGHGTPTGDAGADRTAEPGRDSVREVSAAASVEAYPDLEWAVEAAASIAAHLAEEGFALHLATHRSVGAGILTERRSAPEALRELAEVGAQTRPPAGERALALSEVRELVSAGGLLIVVTLNRDPQAIPELLTLRPATGHALLLAVTHRPGPVTGVTDARMAGWSATSADRHSDPASAWAQLIDQAAASADGAAARAGESHPLQGAPGWWSR